MQALYREIEADPWRWDEQVAQWHTEDERALGRWYLYQHLASPPMNAEVIDLSQEAEPG